MYLDTFFPLNTHCVQEANRVSKRNTVLKALAGTNRDGTKIPYAWHNNKALGRSIVNNAAPAWSTNVSSTNMDNIQRDHNEALRLITCSHTMSSNDHLHSETIMLQLDDHMISSLCNIWYIVLTQRTYVTTSPWWIIHQDRWKRHSSLDTTKHQERYMPENAHHICQYINRQHDG